MKVTFLGPRGKIEARTARHRMHTALLLSFRRSRVMIDCGADWAEQVRQVNPTAILITHAHPDHADGLRYGVPCPVLATAQSWRRMLAGEIVERIVIEPRAAFRVNQIRFEAFPLEHSIRAPAVGYRISHGRVSLFYAPDLVSIHGRHEALAGVQYYIGDGASILRPILRKRGNILIGHASIRMQLDWCREEGVRRAIFTHCGTEIVSGEERKVSEKVAALGKQAGVKVQIAFDGMELALRY
ncbi:MAG: MBL fold metallo-hydrolase [Acidobacteria bacterium]|nr:MBL fold metallo-hydrolase [Acidobacteriota bacterium]